MDSTPSKSPQVGEPTSDTGSKTPAALKQSGGAAHKRTYQACLPCRKRKVKCDLGSVDAPSDPPCLRCRREKKECVFSETRRKRKLDDDGSRSDVGEDFAVRPTKRTSIATDGPLEGVGLLSDGQNIQGLPNVDVAGVALDGNRKSAVNRNVKNDAAAALLHGLISEPKDAFYMLVDAATKSDPLEQVPIKQDPDGSLHSLPPEVSRRVSAAQRPGTMSPAIDPAIMQMEANMPAQPNPDLVTAVQAWSRLRFVRAGWFTPEEGIAYIKYFYEQLSPLSPVAPPDFSPLSSHGKLLSEEPMLTVTLLTIASRYMTLKGPGGTSRTFWVHDKLWEYLQNMITRMFWGQEQFGGGFCGAGSARTEESEARRRGLRSLGTVESLLLLSDWLPRSMHFPPGDDGDELLAPEGDPTEGIQTMRRNQLFGWTEPAIRSDRMVWSLVGMAYSLAFELGVFDSLIEHGKWCVGPQAKTAYDPERADRAGRMLFVYVTQACGRLGYPNMMPHQGTETNLDFLRMDVPPGKYSGPYPSVTQIDKIQRAWAHLTTLIRESNTELFESKERTQQYIQSGQHLEYIEKFNAKLNEWKENFEQTETPPKAKILLLMEWEYSRTYINSLSVQAVLEHMQGGVEDAYNQEPSTAQTPPALFSSKVVDVKKQNEPYIKEVVDASRSILDLALKGLRSEGSLKHAPVRTHFRILSGAMFLLKTFALGGKENEIGRSLKLLTDIAKALKDAVPDDSHLSLRIAELLYSLTTSIKTKFVRLPVRGSKRSSTQARPSSAHTSNPTSSTNPGSVSKGISSRNDHRRNNSFTSTNNFSNLRVVDPNDPNITIMPPTDYLHQSSFYDPAIYNGGPNSPRSAGVYSPATVPANMNGGSPANSPTLTSAQPHHQRHHIFPFSPTQTPTTATAQTHHPFSPLSTGSNPSNDWWLALNLNEMVNAQPTGSGHGAGAGLTAHSGMGSDGAANNPNAGTDANPFVTASPWNGGAFGPEISEGLDMLHSFGAVGNLGWDEPANFGAGPPTAFGP